MNKLFTYYLKISYLVNIENVVHLGVKVGIRRGQKAESYSNLEETSISTPIYKEHNNEYLLECIENLAGKGIKLDI